MPTHIDKQSKNLEYVKYKIQITAHYITKIPLQTKNLILRVCYVGPVLFRLFACNLESTPKQPYECPKTSSGNFLYHL
jgi:hypothetical protein